MFRFYLHLRNFPIYLAFAFANVTWNIVDVESDLYLHIDSSIRQSRVRCVFSLLLKRCEKRERAGRFAVCEGNEFIHNEFAQEEFDGEEFSEGDEAHVFLWDGFYRTILKDDFMDDDF